MPRWLLQTPWDKGSPPVAWLWQGYLAGGMMINLLTSLSKSGNTTLLSVLLAKLKNRPAVEGLEWPGL